MVTSHGPVGTHAAQMIQQNQQAQQAQALAQQQAAYEQQMQQMQQAIIAAQSNYGGGGGGGGGGGKPNLNQTIFGASAGGKSPSLTQGGGGDDDDLGMNAILEALGVGSFEELIGMTQTAMSAEQAAALQSYKDQVINLMGTGSASTAAIGDYMKGQEGQSAANLLGLFGQTFGSAAGYEGQLLQGQQSTALQAQQAQQAMDLQSLQGLMGTVSPVSGFYGMPAQQSSSGMYQGSSQGGGTYNDPFTGNAAGSYNNPMGGNQIWDAMHPQSQGGSMAGKQAVNQWQDSVKGIGMRGRSLYV